MQNRTDAGQEKCRTGGMQDTSYAGQEGFIGKRNNRTGGTQKRRDTGQEEF